MTNPTHSQDQDLREGVWYRNGSLLYTLKPYISRIGRTKGFENRDTVRVDGPDAEAIADRLHAALSAAPQDQDLRTALTDVLREYDRGICEHEETHRGGFIWTICDQCGRKWADDEGGFQPHVDPPAVVRAREILCQEVTAPPRPDHTGGVSLHAACVEVAKTYDAMLDATRKFHVAYDADVDVAGASRDSQAAQETHRAAVGRLVNCARKAAQAPDKAAEREGVDRWEALKRVSMIQARELKRLDPTGETPADLEEAMQELRAALASKPAGTEAGRGVGAVSVEDKAKELCSQCCGWADKGPCSECMADREPGWLIDAHKALAATPTPPTPDSTGPAEANGLRSGNISAMAEAMWQAESVRCLGKKRLISFDEEGAQERKKWYGLALAANEALTPSAPSAAPVRDALSGLVQHIEQSRYRCSQSGLRLDGNIPAYARAEKAVIDPVRDDDRTDDWRRGMHEAAGLCRLYAETARMASPFNDETAASQRALAYEAAAEVITNRVNEGRKLRAESCAGDQTAPWSKDIGWNRKLAAWLVSFAEKQLADTHDYSARNRLRWAAEALIGADGVASLPAPAGDVPGEAQTQAARDVLAERRRQVEAEGWTPEHDDEHRRGEIARAAATYAMAGAMQTSYLRDNFLGEWVNYKFSDVRSQWPGGWDWSWFKPSHPRRDLVKAAALILAEIERLDRSPGDAQTQEGGR